MKKYIVPPRLNEKLTYFGLTAYEGLAILVIFFVAMGICLTTSKITAMIIPAIALVSRIRFINGENICEYGKKVYNYFFKTQSYSINGE